MTDTLFDLPESPSPRLRWMQQHKISLTREMTLKGEHFTAWVFPDTSGYGYSADDALADLARKINVKLWNQP
jgi:hypothetical protein